jgi:hypothetical protein
MRHRESVPHHNFFLGEKYFSPPGPNAAPVPEKVGFPVGINRT